MSQVQHVQVVNVIRKVVTYNNGTYKVITEYNYDSNSLEGLLGEEHHSSFI